MCISYTLITGAASGFGRCIAKRLAPTCNLLLSDICTERLEVTRQACTDPDRHLVWVRDLNTVAGTGDALGALLISNNITVDHFIHSAGLFGVQHARACDMTFVSHIFNVNLFAAMEIIKPLVQKRANKGALRTITFISSINSRLGAAGYSVYAASKSAVNAQSISLSVELAPMIRVNAVLPGIIETEMNKEHFEDSDFVASLRATHPLGLGQSEDIADAVEFLISDKARWITGQEIVVDGGRLAAK